MASSVAQIIEEKGGSAAFAKAVGLDPGSVRMMKHRGKFPRTVWPEIMTAFEDLTLEVLMSTEPAAAGEAA